MAENYTVTGQSNERDFTFGNRVIEYHTVHFVTPDGDEGKVRVPADRATPEHLAQELDAAARTLRQIRNL